MNGRSIRVFSINGIELRLDYSWFILFALIVLSFTTGILPTFYPELTDAQTVVVGILGALLLFVSVVVHEFAHALYAKKTGLRINRITLFIFGGAAELQDEPRGPGQEFAMAGLGPLASILIGLLFGLVWVLGRAIDNAPVAALGSTLASVNILLALFNLLPGFPLDGGRLFRALVWKTTGSMLRGTWAATLAGKILAVLLIAYGLFEILVAGALGGVWLVLVGFFLYRAAAAGYEQAVTQSLLKDVSVADVMCKGTKAVPGSMTVKEYMQDHVLARKQTVAPVRSSAGGIAGMVSAEAIADAPLNAPVEEFANGKEIMLHPEDPASQAVGLVGGLQAQEVAAVVKDGKLLGTVSAENIRSYLLGVRKLRGL